MSKSKLLTLMALVLFLSIPAAGVWAQQPELISFGAGGTAVISDREGLSDAITYKMAGLSSPGEGKVYEGWLINSAEPAPLSTGVMTVDDSGAIDFTYVSPTGENLIHLYDTVKITVESVPDEDPGPSSDVAFGWQISEGGIAHIRHLLTNWPAGSDAGILTRLKNEIAIAYTQANQTKNASTLDDVKHQIELVVNAIEGASGANYADHDGDGTVEDVGDGNGVLFHAADSKHADFAITSAGAGSAIAVHGALVLTNAQSAAAFATGAVQLALDNALIQTDVNRAKLFMGIATGVLDNALNGFDLNGSDAVESVAGEAGAQQAYEEAQLMATYTLREGVTADPTPTLR